MQGIITNAQNQQDNVLVEYQNFYFYFYKLKYFIAMFFFEYIRYEAALLLNKLYGVPVFPIFLAEIETDNAFVPFNFGHNFPDVLHNREKSSQQSINHLRDVITGVVIFFKKN
jgi:hypothetical protein